MSQVSARVREKIVDVPDFPKPGVTFKDITPLLQDPAAFTEVVDAFAARWADAGLDQVVGIESRGFLFGAPVAQKLGVGLTLLRKPGKLPRETVSQSYSLEYGEDELQIHADSFAAGKRAVILDDVLATGGTAAAAAALVTKAGGELVEVGFLMELSFLPGAAKLGETPRFSLITY